MEDIASSEELTTRRQVSTRDRGTVREELQAWLAHDEPEHTPTITAFEEPAGNGASNDTLLFDVEWSDGRTERLVARLAPDADAVPIYMHYDLERQYRTMEQVAARSNVPVPPLRAFEADPAFLGTPFIVMHRVDGVVPSDMPPYAFGTGWVYDATDAERAHLEASTVKVLADLHAIPGAIDAFSWMAPAPGRSALRAHFDEQLEYAAWASDGRSLPVVERGFEWLEANWPGDDGETVLSWGDSRIGNVIYRDFAPAAVLDWEMCAVGPRELDLGWLIFFHRFVDDLAVGYGLPGLPDLLRRDAVAARYEQLTGHAPEALDWYVAYAGVRFAIIMTKIGLRMAHLGEAELPTDMDALVPHAGSIDKMIAGTYWDSVPR